MPRAKKVAAADTVADQAVSTHVAPEQQLIAVEDISTENAPAIFGKGSLSAYVALARQSVIGEVPDLTTDKGRKRIASLAAQVSRSKTALDEKGRDYLRQLKSLPKVIEGELREFNTDMDALRDEVRAPLNAWEKARDEAEAALQSAIDQVAAFYTLPESYTAQDLRDRISQLEEAELTADVFGERLEEAELKRTHGLKTLGDMLPALVQQEAEAAELAQLRKEKEEREKREHDERIAQEARDQVLRDQQEQTRLANERAEKAERLQIETEAYAENAQRNQKKEIERAGERAAQAERDRATNEQLERDQQAADQKYADDQRAADEEHRAAINSAALDALVQFAKLDEAQAKAVVIAIVRNQVPNVSIFY